MTNETNPEDFEKRFPGLKEEMMLDEAIASAELAGANPFSHSSSAPEGYKVVGANTVPNECIKCGLLRSTVLATGKNCLKGTEHDFGDHGLSFPDRHITTKQ